MIKKHWRRSHKKRLKVNALVLPTLHRSTFFFSSHLSVGLKGFLVFPGCLFPTSWDLSEWWMGETLPAAARFKLSARWAHVAMKLLESCGGCRCTVSPPSSASCEGPCLGTLLGPSGGQVARRVSRRVNVQVSPPQLAELELLGLPWGRNFVGTRWFLFWHRWSCFIVPYFSKN